MPSFYEALQASVNGRNYYTSTMEWDLVNSHAPAVDPMVTRRLLAPPSNLTFGVELEIIAPVSNRAAEWAVAILDGAGVDCHDDGYGHTATPYWRAVHDSSVGGVHGHSGIELVSPVLMGTDGLREVNRVCTALQAAGAYVNHTCGLHVHISGSDFDPDSMDKNIARNRMIALCNLYVDFLADKAGREPAHYCKAVVNPEVHVDQSMTAGNWRSEMRYYAINFCPLLRKDAGARTVEIRAHAGSIDPNEVTGWIRSCLSLVETAVKFPAYSNTEVPSFEGFCEYCGLWDCYCNERCSLMAYPDMPCYCQQCYDEQSFRLYPYMDREEYNYQGLCSLSDILVYTSEEGAI